MSKKKKSRRTVVTSKEAQEQEIVDVYEGQRLNALLDKIWRSIELAKLAKGELSDNIWIKQQFAIGVNDVTRLLERMPQGETIGDAYEISCSSDKVIRRATLVPLQVVLVAADCNPKWLTKHIPTLASSRKVPLIIVRDGSGGSLRLGGLLKLKTALAIGVKVVLVAADCNPKWLTKHVSTLASSRKVPVIIVRDGRGGSLRLGGLLKLKTALAIGVKVRGSAINATFEEII